MADKTINLIIIDDSFDTEEKVISTLRTLGFAARSSRVEDDEDLIAAIKKNQPDLVLYSQGMELISLKVTCKIIKENTDNASIPVIAVDKSETEANVTEAISAGAMDLSSYENMKHLTQVIKREVNAYRNWKENQSLRKDMDETERRCNSLLDSSRDAIAYVHEGMHVYSNESYLELFGIEHSDELEGIPMLDMVAQDSRDEFKTFLRNYMKNETGLKKLETRLHKPDGEEFDGEMEFSSAKIDAEPCIQIVIRQEDGVDTEEMERQIKLVSQKDQLTGLYNRQYCLEELKETISKCKADGGSAAIMDIRLDNFDNIKKEVGVVSADEYIVAVAKELQAVTDEGDILSRYTHDSFSIIAHGRNKDTIEDYAKKIQGKISDFETSINNNKINTSGSIGATLIDKNSPETNELLARLEKAYNDASAAGTNQFSLYIPKEGEMTQHEVDSKLKALLTDAIVGNKFVLYYQPIVSLHGDPDERYEVFLRLKGEDNALIMPEDFLPGAERIGMATPIDRWVLTRIMKLLHERLKNGTNTRFFISLSTPSIKDDALIQWLGTQVKELGLPAGSLNFAVKEMTAITNLKFTKAMSENLKKIQCDFTLDDFGTTDKPLQVLDHINVDYVRLDKSFMEDLLESTEKQEAIQSLAEQVSERSKQTIIQNVLDPATLSVLWGTGVHFMQGDFLQGPEPVLNYDFAEMSG